MFDAPKVLPTRSDIQKRRQESSNVGSRAQARPQATGTVVIVEDTPDIRKLMKFILEDFGMQVTQIGDGQSATEMIEILPAPDLVIMDRMLPFVSGDTLVKQIRNDPNWSEVPVVVVSAKARGTDVVESLEAGANDYITKPFNPKHFMEVVGRYIQ